MSDPVRCKLIGNVLDVSIEVNVLFGANARLEPCRARSSARLFGSVFRLLAKVPDKRNRELAETLWDMMSEYDFSEQQMGEDDALIALGLARRVDDPDFPGERVTIYGPEVKAKRGRK